MPTFDFHCTSCDHVFEFQRPFGSDALPACPGCGSKKTEKLITPPAIQFKGSGFYKTDNRKTPTAAKENKPDQTNKSTEPTKSDPSQTAKPQTDTTPRARQSSTIQK